MAVSSRLRDNHRHLFGDLSLVTLSLNFSMQHLAFDAKSDQLSKSLMALNTAIVEQHIWDEAAIA